MPQKVLNEDWSDYDNRKIRDLRDAKDFACTESWEVDYLVSKIRKVYPTYNENTIRNAISSCCRTVGAPHPRKAFVECVMQRLRS
jgi:hypothetical protein